MKASPPTREQDEADHECSGLASGTSESIPLRVMPPDTFRDDGARIERSSYPSAHAPAFRDVPPRTTFVVLNVSGVTRTGSTPRG